MIPLAIALGMAGCTKPADDTGTGLPPADTDFVRDTDVSEFPRDTDVDTAVNEDPLHTVTMHQWGAWSLSPSGGPYTALTGELRVQEYIDGDRPDTADTQVDTDELLACDLVFALVGAAAESSCDGCAFAFDITFTLVEGNPSECHDPDLPEDGDPLRFGYSAAQQAIVRDYGHIGLWLPWYPADRVGDRVDYDWEATVGVAIEEEDE